MSATSTGSATASEPYPTREDATEAVAAHVNRGKTRALQAIGIEIVVGEREGARFRDAYSGRWYWNCHCNGGVFNLGHRNPGVVAAMREALDHVDVGNHHLISGWRGRLATQLSESTGGRLPFALFTPSGSEAVDLALSLARGHTGRQKIVATIGGYHGLAGLARAASDPRWSEPFGEPLPGFAHVPFNDLEALSAEVDSDTAAVILESIPATLGFPPPAPGYLREAGELARRSGALLILDEVQTGLGRTGTAWFHQQEGAEPDAIITGKGLGGGLYPISAALVSEELEGFFDERPFAYVSTFGGSELGCVAASVVMDEVTRPEFLERVGSLGERFQRGFEGLPFELRRRGLTMGLAFAEDEGGVLAAKRLIDAGVFSVYAEHDHRVTQFKPPLILSDGEADEIIATVAEALGVSLARTGEGLSDTEIRALDGAVERALRTGDEGGLRVLGSGEISLVLGWPAAEPAFACKRLPAFGDRGRFEAYGRTLADYVEALRAAGVEVVETDFMPVEHPDGSVVGYAVQPVLPAETLAPRVLAAADPGAGHPLVEAIAARILAVVSPRLGIDAQLSNWTWEDGGRLRYLDVTTPLLWSADGRPLLDIDLLARPLPAIVRPPLKRFLGPRILDGYRNLRGVMSDLCGNLLKERLDPWVPVFLEAVSGALDPPMSEEEVRRYYRSDARLWEALLRLRRLDRAWYRHVRRHTYPYLLPAKVRR